MPIFTESLLVIDNGRKLDSIPVNALSSLGYRNITHVGFDEGLRAIVTLARLDAVVVYWSNELSAGEVAQLIGAAKTHCSCEAALMISAFCTEANIQTFRKAGISAWVTVPFTRRDLGARLRYALEGERRQAHIPVPVERRRQAPMPAFA
jgi:hypothetical protein